MKKPLSEMSLEELWQLFPIYLTEHRPQWQSWYEEEAAMLRGALSLVRVARISPIGSTAVKGIWAKPIIDILVEMEPGGEPDAIRQILAACGYRCMSQDAKRMSFNKGYTHNGFAERVYHLHLRGHGDNDELYFRDYLNDHPHIAKQYEQLKLSLWKRFEHDRDGYTRGKTAFITNCIQKAKREYGGRYAE